MYLSEGDIYVQQVKVRCRWEVALESLVGVNRADPPTPAQPRNPSTTFEKTGILKDSYVFLSKVL